MAEINVKVRLGTDLLYNTKIRIDTGEPVINLKNKLCQKDESLSLKRMIIVYCGCVMEDNSPLFMYDLFDGATVHVYKDITPEKTVSPTPSSESDIKKLVATFRSFLVNSSYRAALLKLNKPEVINKIIITTPGLNEDPVALTLLQHPELLVKLNDFESVKRITDNHPAFALAVMKIASAVQEEVSQVIFIKTNWCLLLFLLM
jgi:hypothetical protein